MRKQDQALAELRVLDWTQVPGSIRVESKDEAMERAVAEHRHHVGRLLRVCSLKYYSREAQDYCQSVQECVVRVRDTAPTNFWYLRFVSGLPQVVEHGGWSKKVSLSWQLDIIDHPYKDDIEHAWMKGRTYLIGGKLSDLEKISQSGDPDYR